MQVVLQRVRRATVHADGDKTGEIAEGLMALVGVGRASTSEDARWLAAKTRALRLFPDEEGRMNRSVDEIGGGVLAVSQFTLYADTRKGRRPSFVDAAEPEMGALRYEEYCEALHALGVPVARGRFGAHMVIDIEADGPVTIILRSEAGDRS